MTTGGIGRSWSPMPATDLVHNDVDDAAAAAAADDDGDPIPLFHW